MSGFWRTWLTVWCWGVALFGAVLAAGGVEATNGPARMLLAIMHGGGDLAFDGGMPFAVALMGAVTLGWALTLMTAIRAAHHLGRPIWLGIVTSLSVWFVVDSILSVETGFALNAVSNAILYAAFMAPVLMSGVLGRSAQAAA